jgi:phosphotransferase system, enzyme I, PtsP
MPSDSTQTTREYGAQSLRRLLSRVRAIMADSGEIQQRLDRIVEIIAAEMVAEVCSLYVRRAGDLLELFSTQGLHTEAVHNTHLRIGEGLVGDIAAHARPLALSDAQSHPNFAYRPETGEDIFHSLMGVPAIRGGKVVGVLVVQNRTQRHYTEEERETLETIAMVLAEMVAGGELIDRAELSPVDGLGIKPLRLEGLRLHGGLGMGNAVIHQAFYRVDQVVADNIEEQHEVLDSAYSAMHGELDTIMSADMSAGALAGAGEHHDIMEAYRMIANDAGWLEKLHAAIESGLTAEAAVERVQNELRSRMSQIADPYLRERIHDIEDLGIRLMRHLHGNGGNGGINGDNELPEHIVLVAKTLGPAQLFDYDVSRLRAVILEEGSPTSHAAIVARALDIPVIAQVKGVMERIDQGDQIIVDGDAARIFLRPSEDVQQTFKQAIKTRNEQSRVYDALRDWPTRTKDGADVSLSINAGLLIDLNRVHETGSAGIGLYRTEVPFMVRPEFPDVDEQETIYREIYDGADGKPVVFRTLDVGGDKILPYWEPTLEENPAMGWRSIRISLDHPAMLRGQLRALIRAAQGRELRIMFPMISNVHEFKNSRALLDIELERHKASSGIAPVNILVGAMLEVPALAFQLDALLQICDFISVGSNDLMQFLFARDRGNPRMAGRYDTLSPSVLAYLRMIVQSCEKSGKPLSLCGEMAGYPVEAMALLGIGFRQLSMVSSSIGPVKAMVLSMNLKELEKYILPLLNLGDVSLRARLSNYARDHGIEI